MTMLTRLSVVVTLVVAVPVLAQQEHAPSAEETAMMEAWAKAATPGPEHARLAQLEGEWDMTIRSWTGPGAPPAEARGSSTYRMILGGRYLEQTAVGEMGPEMGGAEFHGAGLTGYDNMRGVYVATWVDNMGTGILYAEGRWDDDTASLVTHAEYLDPMSGTTKKVRMVTRIVSPVRHVFEWHEDGPDGGDVKAMEIEYTRR